VCSADFHRVTWLAQEFNPCASLFPAQLGEKELRLARVVDPI
jgi:hypothetical protein